MFYPTQINALARTAHALVEGEGQGSTIYAANTLRRRYVVGGLLTRIYPVGTPRGVLREGLRAMAGDRKALIADTLGCWEENGAVYVDLGQTFHDYATAMDVATERGELAIYDRQAHMVLRVVRFA